MSSKKEITKELLNSALVPKEKHLKKLPENWNYVYFTSILGIIGGTQPPKSEFISEPREGYIRLIQIRDFTSDEYITYVPLKKNLKLIEEEDILIARYGASVGRILTGLKGAYNVALAKVTFSNDIIDSKYLYWLLQTEYFQGPVRMISRSAQAGFNKNDLSNFIIPLPPLNEQKRIAKKVTELVEKIEESSRLIKEAQESFELRRASILDKAFRGELLSPLEKNKKVIEETPYSLPEGWIWKKFKDIASVKSKLVDPNSFMDYPHIAPDNIEKKTGRLLSFNSIKEDGVKSPKHLFKKGQILYSKIRPYLSKVIIADFEGLCSADMYPIETELNTEYLYLYMLSPFFVEQASSAGSRSVLPKINQKELGEIFVPIPPEYKDQVLIVNKIRKILDLEYNLNEILELEDKINLIKQSVLSKAIHGELRTNDSTEENTVELLREFFKSQ